MIILRTSLNRMEMTNAGVSFLTFHLMVSRWNDNNPLVWFRNDSTKLLLVGFHGRAFNRTYARCALTRSTDETQLTWAMQSSNNWQSTRWRQDENLFSSRGRNHLHERLAYTNRFHSRTFLWADLTWSCVAAVLLLAFPHLPTDASVTVSKSNFIHSVTISHLQLQYIHRYLLSSVACGVLSIAGRSPPLPPATPITCRRWILACPMVNLIYRSESLLVELENLFALRCLTRELIARSLSLPAF